MVPMVLWGAFENRQKGGKQKTPWNSKTSTWGTKVDKRMVQELHILKDKSAKNRPHRVSLGNDHRMIKRKDCNDSVATEYQLVNDQVLKPENDPLK